jgi:hypothetical protein
VGLCEEQQPPPVVESWKYWQHEDVKTLDVWGETADEHSDLVALYEKEEPSHIALRVDYMNLTSSGVAPTFLGLDFKSGGVSNVIQGNNGLNLDIAWDVLIVADGENISAFDTTFTEITAVLSNLVIDRHVDYLSLDLDQSALPGWGGGEFSLQALTTNANRTSQRDATPVAQTDDVTGRGKFVLTFMNAFATDGPWGISAYDGYSYRHEERPGERRGLRYLLDAAEKYDVPVQIADLRVNNIGGSEFMGINDRFRDMFENDQIDLLSNHDYGQHMVWWPDEVNRAIQDISLKLKARMDLPSTETVYPYESIIRVRDIAVLKEAGFTTIWALDQYPYWFGVDDVWGNLQLMKETNRNLRKIHRMNGMNVVFSSNTYLSHVFDQRWEGEGDEWSMDWISKGTDQGLHHWYRRTLLDLAQNEDQQQFVTFGTDIELTHWVYQAETDWSFKWLAAHPWVDVTTFNDIGSRGWGVIDHGTLDLDEDDFLQQYEINNEGLMDYFTQNYYGGISSGHSPVIPEGVEIEALYDYVPYLRDGQFIPSGRIFGDYKTPGSIVYETLSKLRSAPNNDLRDLAWLMFSTLIAEVSLHEAEVLASGGKQQANWLGHVGKIVAAAHWAEATEDGEFSSLTVTRAEDLDLDGEDEYIIHNDQVFAVFENDGGYLEYAFAWSSEAGPVQLVAPLNQKFRYFGSGDFHSAGEIAFIAESGGTASFFDTDEKNGASIASVMAATVQNDALVFTEPNGLLTKRFTLAGDTLTASYSLTGIDALVAGFCFTTNMMAMYEKDWHDNFEPVEKADFTGWQTSRGGYAGLNISGLGAVSFLDSPVADEKQEREDPDSYPEGHWSVFPWGCVQTWLGGSPEFDVGITLRATSEIME